MIPSVRDPDSYIREKRQAREYSLRAKAADGITLQILQNGEVRHEITRDSTTGFLHKVFSLSPDGALLASGGENGFLTLYSTSTGMKSAECVGHTADLWAVAFSPDGRTLVSGSGDQTVRLWNVTPTSCSNLLSGFIGSDNEWVAWTPNGYYTASANGDKYIGWQVNQGLDKAARFYPATQFRSQFYRPDVVTAFLRTRNIESAVKEADVARGARGQGALSTQVLGPSDILKNLPPRIVVFEPFAGQLIAKEHALRIRAAAVADQPITTFEVLVNGTCRLGCDTNPLTGSQSEVHLDAQVELQPGENKVDFLASHAKASSPTKELLVTWQPPPGEVRKEKPKLIVLTVGISHFTDPRLKLDWAAKDAIDLENAFLSQKNNALYGEVIHHHIVNTEVTAQRILDELTWLNHEGDDSDIRVVFLSGRGGMDTAGNYYFYAANHDPANTADNDLRWQTLLERLALKNRKAVLIVDTSRGGVNFDHVLGEAKSRFRGLFTLAASMGTESSFEVAESHHGAFTKALLDALNDPSAAGKVLSTDDLTNRVKEGVKALKLDQHPTSTYTPSLLSFPFFQVPGRRP